MDLPFFKTIRARHFKLIPKLSDCRGLPASGCVAADTRKMSFRYSQLCGTASDAVDAVGSAIPKGFKF